MHIVCLNRSVDSKFKLKQNTKHIQGASLSRRAQESVNRGTLGVVVSPRQ